MNKALSVSTDGTKKAITSVVSELMRRVGGRPLENYTPDEKRTEIELSAASRNLIAETAAFFFGRAFRRFESVGRSINLLRKTRELLKTERRAGDNTNQISARAL